MIALFVGLAAGHGSLVIPPPRNTTMTMENRVEWGHNIGCYEDACQWFNQGCTADCTTCDESNQGFGESHCESPDPAYKPFINSTMKEFITYDTSDLPDNLKNALDNSPWRYPGKAPVIDSCGVSSGVTKGHNNSAAGGYGVPGFATGTPGSTLPPQERNQWNVWTAGETVEVAMGLTANHGGGYQYRLCPADENLDEKCFQKTPLQYANDTSKLFWLAPESGRLDKPMFINATRLSVRDEQDVWTKNPVPAFKCLSGGAGAHFAHVDLNCPDKPQFAPPAGLDSEYWGFFSVVQGNATTEQMKWLPFISDFVVVPDYEGHYVLSWRWDSEQTPQVWTNCADVYIQKSKPVIL
jgi:hypothetical protein